MSALSHGEAVILGIVQGLTEFLPVSSSGHLAIVQRWMDLPPESPGMLLFDVLAHLATLIAVLAVFAGPIKRFLRRLTLELTGGSERAFAKPVCFHVIVATIVTAGIALPFQSEFEAMFDQPRAIGVFLIFTGIILAGQWLVARGRRGWRDLRWWHAGVVGLAQAAAILPGISRSGATICAASWCGLRRRWAAQFSFLIAVPAIAGAAAKKLIDTMQLTPAEWEPIRLGPILVGSFVAGIVGALALLMLLSIVRRGRLYWFSAYCWVLGVLVLAGVL